MITEISLRNLIAIWGAGLSSLLAVVKLWEMWKSRSRIEVSHNFTGNAEVGNDVIIRNLSSTPIILTYFEVLRIKRNWFKKKEYILYSPYEASSDRVLKGYSSHTFNFSHQDYFDWGIDAMKKGKIYASMHFAGKAKPVVVKVYG